MISLSESVGLAILAFEILHLARKRSHTARDVSADRSSLRIVWISCLTGVVLAFVLRMRATTGHFALGPAWTAVALAVVALGFALRIWSIATLGRFFTVDVAIRAGHELVRGGPFRFVRHPSYSGLLLMFCGWAPTFQTTWSIPALLVPFVLALHYRMHVEEAALAAAFGAAWDEYSASRARVIPGIY